MDFAANPVLENDIVCLEPLSSTHHDDLAAAVAEGDLWRTWYTRIPSPDGVAAEIDRRLGEQAAGRMAPWAVVDVRTGRALGMTTYCNIDAPNRRVEIGYTWLARSAQGTGVNPAAKLLLLERAFDELDCVCVQFCTHWHNQQSRAAIARLGARQDGVLRAHAIFPDGHVRDTVVFSILPHEWAAVRLGLEARLERHREAARA
ncbi:GNAT family protein [Microbacterium sp. JZ37]|uniref:GNAT family N-acetyltransferase n=1 Tax=Microbacterium sp. JZ37 TaxID=2654193 RepID=UPI002B48443C|nr:GNAT family protein [Microbacterium sp. JZ37]WRH17168.1 GNAT family N-acetyltransferase [Microbacterium sp. JZ37]